jgi:hypothetical protein
MGVTAASWTTCRARSSARAAAYLTEGAPPPDTSPSSARGTSDLTVRRTPGDACSASRRRHQQARAEPKFWHAGLPAAPRERRTRDTVAPDQAGPFKQERTWKELHGEGAGRPLGRLPRTLRCVASREHPFGNTLGLPSASLPGRCCLSALASFIPRRPETGRFAFHGALGPMGRASCLTLARTPPRGGLALVRDPLVSASPVPRPGDALPFSLAPLLAARV